ncbi:chorismate mutase [Streptomyces sp. NPDC059247]|uniref:chorismate mutase n=1 Tax=Streptomyces sp. NPDC059247 TaxID=3346790 RepID=UPI003680C95B
MAVRAVRGTVRRDRDGAVHPCEQGGEPLVGLHGHDTPVTGGPLGARSTAVPGGPGGGPAAARTAAARTTAARTAGARTSDTPLVHASALHAERPAPPPARPLARVGADLPKPRTAPARPGAAPALRKDITP